MSLVSDVIESVRVEINDTANTRFPDDTKTIMPLLKQAIRRAARIAQRNQLQFAKKSVTLQTVAGQNYVDMPTDLDIPLGIWTVSTHEKMHSCNETEWEQIIVAAGTDYWFLDLESNKILLNATPTGVTDLKIWYFPKIDVSAYTTATTMPWNGRLDDIIARYVALRIQNIEEANTAQDQNILAEMEQSIISAYAPQSPLMIARDGWL